MKESERPTVFALFYIPGQEFGLNLGSNEIVTLTAQETSDVYVVVAAYHETSNARIACCTGEGACF
jgi:hypothetical protein